jgi:hypothetical protein
MKTAIIALVLSGWIFSATVPIKSPKENIPTEKDNVTVNVKNFGAVGNGKTDDYSAIQSAINSASSGIIYFPAGVYLITKGLVLNSSNTVLKGSGKNTASMILSACNSDIITVNGQRCSIDGLAIDGNGNSKNGKGYNTKGDGIVINGTQSEVTNCIIQNCAGNGINAPYVQGSNHNKNISSCKIYTCKQTGIIVSSNDMYIKDCEIANNEGNQQVILAGANNRIYNCHVWSADQYTTNKNTVGVEIRGDGGQVQGCVFDRNNKYGVCINPNEFQSVNTAIVANNWFYQNGVSGIHFSAGSNIVIIGNAFRNDGVGTYTISGDGAKYKNITISNNTFDDNKSRFNFDESRVNFGR